MPLKLVDPFADAVELLDASVNPYVALLREGTASGALPVFYGPALNSLPGRWRDKLADYYDRPVGFQQLVVEIGCHKGQTLLTMAAAYPDIAFVGIDITFKRVITTAQRAQAKKLRNVFTVLANANALARMFAPEEIDACVIFFPDPWVKKERQAKNRLLTPGFCTQLNSTLKAGGSCWLKTDQLGYFEAAAEGLHAAGLRALAPVPADGLPQAPAGGGLPGLLGSTFSSVFEERFRAMGLPTYEGKWLKSKAES